MKITVQRPHPQGAGLNSPASIMQEIGVSKGCVSNSAIKYSIFQFFFLDMKLLFLNRIVRCPVIVIAFDLLPAGID
ncbi:MAG: hypothetical protein HQK78_19455 [Desulfobacterales bacterium]|nr:hypothetical protein [Desulfobacterales bacterium]